MVEVTDDEIKDIIASDLFGIHRRNMNMPTLSYIDLLSKLIRTDFSLTDVTNLLNKYRKSEITLAEIDYKILKEIQQKLQIKEYNNNFTKYLKDES